MGLFWLAWKQTVSTFEAACLLFTGYVLLSLLWTPDIREGQLHAQNVAAAVVAGIWLCRVSSRHWLPLITVAAILMVWTQEPIMWAGFGNENWLTEFLLVGMVGSLASLKHPWWRWASVAAILASLHWLIFVCNSDTRLAGLGGLALFGAAYLVVTRRSYWALTGLLVLVNAVVFAPLPDLLRAVYARIETTWNTGILWLEKPLTGHGVGSFNYEYPRVQEAHISVFPGIDTMLRPANVYAGAAHNEYIQFLAEYGLVGALLIGLIVLSLRVQWNYRSAVYLAALSTLGGTALVGFPLQNPATVALGCVLVGLLSREAVPVPWPSVWRFCSGIRRSCSSSRKDRSRSRGRISGAT